jgi:5'-3' exonuclease
LPFSIHMEKVLLMQGKTVIFDANALGHVVKHSTRNLSWGGSKTGVIFGFIRKLFKIQADVQATNWIFCWDADKRSLRRGDIFPDYKIKKDNKSPKDKELDKIARPQFKILRKHVLPLMGFSNQFLQKGYEADDTIAQIITQYSIEKFIIVSRDNDLHQLLEGDRVVMFDPVKMGYFAEKHFTYKWGVKPNEWEFVKAIAGCSGDGVPGIEGVKEKTAIKFLKGQLKPTTQAYAKIIAGEKLCLDNLRLVKLPFEDTPSVDEIYYSQPSSEGFFQVCNEYGFNSFLEGNMINEFCELFIDINADRGY